MPHHKLSSVSLITIALLAAATSSLHAAPILSVDIAGSPIQSGFVGGFTGADGAGPRTSTFPVADPAVITGTVTGVIACGSNPSDMSQNTSNLNLRTRANPTNSGDFTYAALYQDRIVGLAPGAGLFLELSGLTPNTAFSIQVWGYDNAKAGNFSLFNRTDGLNDLLGSYTVTAGALPASNDQFSVTGMVTSDATGKIVVQSSSNIDGVGIMNGFVLSTVPEPGSALALAAAGGLLISRRRRRFGRTDRFAIA
jgi:hypothetical protein